MNAPPSNRQSAFKLLRVAMLSRALRAVRSIVLARLLAPEVFGAYALIGAIIGPLISFANVGLTGLVAREAAPSRSLIAAAEWANRVIVYGGGAVLLVTVAVWALVSGRGDLLGPGLVVAAATALYFAPQVKLGLLQQRKQFQSIARMEIAFDICWTTVAVVLAAATKSIWSLVVAEIGSQVLRAAMAKRFAGPGPRPLRHSAELNHLLRFSAATITGSVMWSLVFALPALFLQRHCPTAAIGFFALAYTYGQFAALMLSGVMSRILLPVLGRMPAAERVGAAWRYSQTLSLALAPVSGLVSVAGPSILVGLAGPRWLGAGTPLAILVWAMAARVVFPINALAVVHGRPAIDAYLAIFSLASLSVLELTVGWTSPERAAWFILATDVPMIILAMAIARWLWGPCGLGYREVLGTWIMAGVAAAASWAVPAPAGLWSGAIVRGLTFGLVFGGIALAWPWSRQRYRIELAHLLELARTQLLSI